MDSAVTIKAIAVAEDYQQSEISTFSYGFASQVSAPVASSPAESGYRNRGCICL
ncbi:MAG: hypothetical protein ACLTI1_00070 [Clostridia bacterium]